MLRTSGENLALTVLYVPCSLGNGQGCKKQWNSGPSMSCPTPVRSLRMSMAHDRPASGERAPRVGPLCIVILASTHLGVSNTHRGVSDTRRQERDDRLLGPTLMRVCPTLTAVCLTLAGKSVVTTFTARSHRGLFGVEDYSTLLKRSALYRASQARA